MPHYKKQQTGGRVVKPSEFCGHNSGRYYSAGSPELTLVIVLMVKLELFWKYK